LLLFLLLSSVIFGVTLIFQCRVASYSSYYFTSRGSFRGEWTIPVIRLYGQDAHRGSTSREGSTLSFGSALRFGSLLLVAHQDLLMSTSMYYY
jgi:hypothetical protein